MKSPKVLFLLLLCAGVSTVQAQSVETVIKKHIDAIGGEKVISGMNSFYIQSESEVMGTPVDETTTILNGKGYKIEMNVSGTSVIQCYNENGGWSVNPMMGGSDPQPMDKETAESGKLMLDIGGVLHNYKQKNLDLKLDGTEKVGEVDAIKVKVVLDSTESYYYFDPATYYLIQSTIKNEVMGQPVIVVTSYSDFRKLENGFVLPFKTSVDMGMFTMESEVQKVEINKQIDPAIFDFPGSTSL